MDKNIILQGKNNTKSNNKLSLIPLNKSIQKHPSAKNLFNNEEKKIISNQDLKSFSNSKYLSDNVINVKQDLVQNYSISISNIETKLADENEYFFIKNQNIENIKIKKNENKVQNKNNIFELSEEQKILDKEITMNIMNQKGFNIIEEKLSPFLKVNYRFNNGF